MGKFNFKKKKDERQDAVLDKLTPQQQLILDLKDIVYVLAAFMIVYMLLFRVVVVVGPSMYNTLIDGDRLLLLSSNISGSPERGDIIVASKESFDDGKCFIKRVIATGGQTVDIDFNRGIVYVDGIALLEDYIYTPTTLAEGVNFPVQVPEGYLFVLGDNRGNSKDSRSPQIGLVDEREVLGKAVVLLVPGTNGGNEKAQFNRIGVLN